MQRERERGERERERERDREREEDEYRDTQSRRKIDYSVRQGDLDTAEEK